jgi:chromosome segregation ATPase
MLMTILKTTIMVMMRTWTNSSTMEVKPSFLLTMYVTFNFNCL